MTQSHLIFIITACSVIGTSIPHSDKEPKSQSGAETCLRPYRLLLFIIDSNKALFPMLFF